MMYTISKAFPFAASHQLEGLAEGHKCSRLHGHNYEVEIELSGPLNDAGMVFDYGELEPFAVFLKERVDHRHLNDLFSVNPTAELLAAWLYDCFESSVDLPAGVKVRAVRVRETARTCAEYRP